jgi:hypothetical protein
MALCTDCVLDACIVSTECTPFQPGGFSKLWLANKCEISAFTFNTCAGVANGSVKDFTLSPGANLYTVDFSKNTGLLLDSVLAVAGEGYNWTHTLTIPAKDFNCDTMVLLEKLLGGEFVAFAQKKSGDIVVVGVGPDGLRVTAGNATNGRLGTDARLNDRTLVVVDSYRPLGFIATGAPVDPTLANVFSAAFLDALAPCA